METFRILDKIYSYQDFTYPLSSPIRIIINKDSKKKIKESYNRLIKILSTGQTVYGVNTGFGQLSQIKIDNSDQKKLQLNLIRSHSAGVGDNLNSVLLIMLTYRHT